MNFIHNYSFIMTNSRKQYNSHTKLIVQVDYLFTEFV